MRLEYIEVLNLLLLRSRVWSLLYSSAFFSGQTDRTSTSIYICDWNEDEWKMLKRWQMFLAHGKWMTGASYAFLVLRVKRPRFNLILRPSVHVYMNDPGSSDSDLCFTICTGCWFIMCSCTLHTVQGNINGGLNGRACMLESSCVNIFFF